MKEYTQRHDWKAVEETKGWKQANMRDSLHKVTVEEHETGDKNRQTFNFTPEQTSSTRWKKHVDKWIDRLVSSNSDPTVTE